MNCPYCNQKLPRGQRFCPNCGKPLTGAPVTPTAPTAPAQPAATEPLPTAAPAQPAATQPLSTAPAQPAPQAAPKPTRRLPWPALAAAAVAVAAVAGAAVFFLKDRPQAPTVPGSTAAADGGQTAPDAPDTPDAPDAPAQPPAPLTAQELRWAVEPCFAYDDVEPVWSRDFSDIGPSLYSFSDGKKTLFDDPYFGGAEMNFPGYSCLADYYNVFNGQQCRLFYMPRQQDSGEYYDLFPYSTYDATAIATDFSQLVSNINDAPSPGGPWHVLQVVARGGASVVMFWLDETQTAYLCSSGEGMVTVEPVALAGLHKNYPILQWVSEGAPPQQAASWGWDEEPLFALVDPVEGGKYALMAPDGTLLTDFVYDGMTSSADGITAACLNGQWGYLDENGQPITEFVYDAPWQTTPDGVGAVAYPCTCDTMVVCRGGQMGVLYRDGSVLIDFGQYDDLAPAWNERLWAKQGGQWGLIDLAAAKQATGRPLAADAPVLAGEGPGYTVLDSTVYTTPDGGEVHALQLEGLADVVRDAVNKQLAAPADGDVQWAQQNCDAALPDGERGYLDVRYRVAMATGERLSVLATAETMYGGAAHPTYGMSGYTFDLTTGQRLALADLVDLDALADLLLDTAQKRYSALRAVDLQFTWDIDVPQELNAALLGDHASLVAWLAGYDGRGEGGRSNGASFVDEEYLYLTLPTNHALGDYYVVQIAWFNL